MINLSLELTNSQYKLEDICLQITDGKHGDCENQENSGYYFVSVKDIGDGIIDYSNARQITKSDFEDTDKRTKLENEDILITNSGTIGKFVFVNSPLSRKTTFQKSVAIIKPNKNKIIPKFLYYYLISEKRRLIEYAGGTTQKNLLLRDIRNFEVDVPNESQQKKIIEILNNIDQLISVNKKLNKNLDELLMSIFKSWFVYFDDVDEFKSDENLGEIPKSWSVEMLEDYVDFVTGVEPGSKNYHEKPEKNDIPFIRVGDLGSRDNLVFIDKSVSKNKILKYEDIVLSMDATIGIVKMGLEGAYSTGMRKLVIKNDLINKPFLYCLVKSERIQRIIETFATGTTILHAGKSIKHMNFVLSDEMTMKNFGKIGENILTRILSNMKEIEKLTQLRDTLLPKLMSGEIDVSKINCDIILRLINLHFFYILI